MARRKYASLTADLIKRQAVPCRFIGPDGVVDGFQIIEFPQRPRLAKAS